MIYEQFEPILSFYCVAQGLMEPAQKSFLWQIFWIVSCSGRMWLHRLYYTYKLGHRGHSNIPFKCSVTLPIGCPRHYPIFTKVSI